MHIETKQPQVFILVQSYLACMGSLNHGSQWSLQNDLLWVEIL